MKTNLVFLLVVTFQSAFGTTATDDGCVADVSKYTRENLKSRVSIFKSTGKNVTNVLPSELLEHAFKDHVRLKNGVEVTYTTGGCAHYGYRFIFTGKSIKPIKESEKMGRAEQLLKDLELTQGEERDQLLKGLAEAKKKKATEQINGWYPLPCGDANCELVDRGDHKIEIGYDFAL